MKLQEAINLIEKAFPHSNMPQVWADLGCGGGTFTNALAHLLPDGSHIYAIDNRLQSFPKLLGNNVSIDFIKNDFATSDLNFSNINGILMTNSLHYIKDKATLINMLEKYMSEDKKFVIVEYDTIIANHWVPYPINFLGLKELFIELGYSKIIKLDEQNSIYGQGNLYSVAIGKTF
ncbi:class I SAM-dependent methyltransferase [Chryseobacterium geocarposphaerae]|uniref:Methyltransferase family protein n=1 Tax=Chryseobacterium geocarposphaerae TaxID=1416776 RepID=A0A2M9C6L3_9FLAO|nr:class I SAM-dependent methyltransferase [Chryseobacterium geocarposphaerae]PJJ66442.1 methyltransferase family protein [Chryseobacterium geocarposphaerae]